MIAEIHERREKSIALAKSDPLKYGYVPDCRRKIEQLIAEGFDEIGILGANREGKTTDCAALAVADMANRPCQWAFFHNTERTSINQQQSKIFGFLPPEWRSAAQKGNGLRDGTVKLRYSVAEGFTGGMFVLPGTHSIGYFWNYLQRSEVWEGPEYDGMWFDERVTLPILETARYRLGKDRRLLRLVSFTPKWGYSPVVQNLVAGARVVETRPALLLDQNKVHVKGCPPGHMPFVLHGTRPKSAVIFFHNQMNPMGAGVEVAQALFGAPVVRIMIRGYGWAEKLEKSALPKFGSVHMITRAQFNAIAARGVARYCAADPAGTKNWFVKWYAVTPQGHFIVYREWPDMGRYEEWARSPAELDEEQEQSVGRKYDWRPGPAQRMEAGRGIADYRRMILEAEGWRWDAGKKQWDGSRAERIERRLIDPTFGGASVPGQENTSIVDLMAEPVLDREGNVLVPAMEWEEGVRGTVEEGVEMLASAMDFDEGKPIDATNCPKWYIVVDEKVTSNKFSSTKNGTDFDCLQSKMAYEEFTGLGTQKDALKDVIDPDRYLLKSGYGYVEAEMFRSRGQTYY